MLPSAATAVWLDIFLNKGKINGAFIHYQDTQRNVSHLVQKLRACQKVGGNRHSRVGDRVLGEQVQFDRSWSDCEGVRVCLPWFKVLNLGSGI